MGNIVQTEWGKSTEVRSEIDIGGFMDIQNHLHGILLIEQGGRVRQAHPPGFGRLTHQGSALNVSWGRQRLRKIRTSKNTKHTKE